MDQLLVELYSKNGVYLNEPDKVTLHESCPDRLSWWENEEKIKNSGKDWNKIQKPYIGSKYETQTKRLLAVGTNLYRFGGLDSLEYLFREKDYGVIKLLREGSRR